MNCLLFRNVLLLTLTWLFTPLCIAQSADKTIFGARAEKIYKASKTRLAAKPDDAEAQWQFGRACYDWADFATSDSERARIAQEGMDACKKLIAQDPKSAPGHYYLAMDSGQLARTEELGALRLVSQMEIQFKLALNLNPDFDNGGPNRNLGLLYRDAPGWPTSIGNRSKAKVNLQKAIVIAPNFPENVLNLIESEIKWGDKKAAQQEMKSLDALWPAAREKLTGEDWAADWADWESRRAALLKKFPAKKPTDK